MNVFYSLPDVIGPASVYFPPLRHRGCTSQCTSLRRRRHCHSARPPSALNSLGLLNLQKPFFFKKKRKYNWIFCKVLSRHLFICAINFTIVMQRMI